MPDEYDTGDSGQGTAVLYPDFRIIIDGHDYTDRLTNRLISLTLRDLRGMEADTLALEIDDFDGLIQIPDKGAEISLQIGYEGALRDKGIFTVDNAGHSGPPDRISITAHAADFRGSLRTAKERSWHGKTVGDMVADLAGEHDLAPAVSQAFQDMDIPHLDQTNESDANLLTRLAKRLDAIATVKDKKLLFLPKGRGKTASGNSLPTVTIRRSEGDQHHYEEPDRESNYSGVKTFQDDPETGQRKVFVTGKDDGQIKTLRDPFPTADEAQSAGVGELGRTQRAAASMDLTLARGRPDLMPEQPAKLEGWKPKICDWDWVIDEIEHRIDQQGYTSFLKLEVRLTDLDAAADGTGDWKMTGWQTWRTDDGGGAEV